ncbi:MAG: glycosyltransferase, partial [Fluviicola sp.]
MMKLFPTTENMYQFVLFWTFFGLVFFQVIYVCLFFGRLAFRKIRPQKTEFPPVSIVICARNEADNLYEKLPKILLQNYPAPFEVIVVNNQSVDDSKHLLYAMQRESKNLVIVEMERSKHIRPSKKLPLTLGIKKAQYNHLLLTDADCLPNSNEWIQSM